MIHACVERFDTTDTVGKILGTKRDLSSYHSEQGVDPLLLTMGGCHDSNAY